MFAHVLNQKTPTISAPAHVIVSLICAGQVAHHKYKPRIIVNPHYQYPTLVKGPCSEREAKQIQRCNIMLT